MSLILPLLQLSPVGILAGFAEGALIIGAIAYYATPIFLAFVILFYEILLKVDIGTNIGANLGKIAGILLKKPNSFSLLPSSTPVSHDTQVEILKLETPINIFININRGFLYIAFFLSLIVLAPFSWVANFSPQFYIDIFNLINGAIAIEPLFISTLIIFSLIDGISDWMVDLFRLIKT